MKPKFRHLRSLALVSGVMLSISYAQAATFTWSNLDDGTVVSNGNWSSGVSWTGGAPVSAATTTLSIGYTYGPNSTAESNTLTNDVANPFLLNVLSLTGNPGAANGSFNALINIAGSPLEFVSNVGVTPQVNLSSVRSNGQVVTFNVQSNVVLTNNTLFTGNGTSSFTVSGGISGAGNFSKGGTSKLTLSGTNSYGGTTTISGGILQFTNQVSLYNNTPASWTAANIKVASGATLALDVGGTNQFTTADVTTILNNLGGANGSSSGGFAAGSAIGLVNAGAVSIADTITDTTGTGGGALGITKFGVGTLTLTGANTYTGTTSILQGSLTLAPTAGGMTLGAITLTTGASPALGIAAANKILTLGGAGTNSITSILETSGAAQQLTFTKNTAATWSVGNVNVTSGNTHTVSAGILNLNGTFEWTNTNFDRRITVSAGQLNYNNAGALKTLNGRLQMTGGSMDNTSGAAITTSTHNPGLELAGDWTFIGSNGADSNLNYGTGIVRITGTAGTNRTINVQNANTKLTLGGVISSFTAWNNANNPPNTPAANGLIKAGDGTLVLGGINSYTGATAVNAGTLEIASTGRINTSSGVTINGGTLRYNSSTNLSPTVTFTSGTIAGTNWNGSLSGQTIGTGQTISPGNSPGTATTGSQTWASGGSYLWEVNNATGTAGADPGWDLETGTGTLDISATNISPFNILVTSLTLANAGGLATNFNDATSYNWLFADFASITGFAANAFNINTSDFDNTFTGTFGVSLGGVGAVPGDNSQIYLTYTAIPEPNVAALIGALGGILLLRRRR